jgi:hypothetical protein
MVVVVVVVESGPCRCGSVAYIVVASVFASVVGVDLPTYARLNLEASYVVDMVESTYAELGLAYVVDAGLPTYAELEAYAVDIELSTFAEPVAYVVDTKVPTLAYVVEEEELTYTELQLVASYVAEIVAPAYAYVAVVEELTYTELDSDAYNAVAYIVVAFVVVVAAAAVVAAVEKPFFLVPGVSVEYGDRPLRARFVVLLESFPSRAL